MKKKFERLSARGAIVDGRLVLDNPRWFKGMIQLHDDCKVMVVVERRKKSKSKEQLGYLWGVVYPLITEHTGHTPEELHEIFKSKFLRRRMLWRGTDITTVNGTQGLSTGEMAEFTSKVILEANELGIAIPEPDKLYQFK